jgi:transcriptional regulator NrdR
MLVQIYPFIIKKDGRREEFNREKVLKGIQAACQKRPVSLAQIEQLVERVAKWVLSRPEREITAVLVGQKVIKELRLLDDVAYVRFASVYQNFKNVDEFVSRLGEEKQHLSGDQAIGTLMEMDIELENESKDSMGSGEGSDEGSRK